MKRLSRGIRVTEVDGFSDIVIRMFKADKDAQSDSVLKEIMEDLEKLSLRITEAILRDKIYSTVMAWDKRQINALRALGRVIGGYFAMPIVEKAQKAAPLKEIYEKYTKACIQKTNNTSRSSLIESMLLDFEEPSIAALCAMLEGVPEAIEALRESHAAFIVAGDAYRKALSGKKETATHCKAPLVSIINDRLVPYLSVVAASGKTHCSLFSSGLEKEVNRINAMVSHRHRKAERIAAGE